jgi:prepilin-type N-terminal cleavage/methylation domain-containing protein
MNHLIRKIISKKQNGYTLIETILGLALAGILGVGVTSFAVQSVNVVSDSQDYMDATMQVENAGYWISRDIQMSCNFTLGENAGFPLQMIQKDSDYNDYEVSYFLNENGITRNLTKNEESPVQTLIAKNINTETSLTNLTDINGLLIFNITSTSRDVDVSRTYKIKPRLDWDL